MLLSKPLIFILPLCAASHATLIQWGTCADDFGSPVRVDCGRLFVPLDYMDRDPDAETLSLELLRAPATVQPARGSILLNFGGPGGLGRAPLAVLAPLLQILSGGSYNLIAFDPRGTGSTIPFTCYETDVEKLGLAIDISHVARAQDRELQGRIWARGTITAEKCAQRQNKTGPLIGTAFVARDLMSVAEALGEDGLLRYWGFSYGTTLGATVVSMFPDKIDKVILDGVQNPHEYYHSDSDFEQWSDTDEEFSHIFQHCVANPDACPLARENATAVELEASVWDLIDRLDYRPVPLGDIVLDRSMVSALIVTSLYSPISWPALTTALDMLINGGRDEVFLRRLFGLQSSVPEIAELMATEQAFVGIRCIDKSVRAGSFGKLLPALQKVANVSRVIDGMMTRIDMACAQWKMQARERYEGDFQVSPRNPVLVIGNTWDGLTSLRSAHNVSSGFEGSVVLEVNGYGHASIGLPSACSLKATRSYWQTGKLPQPGTVCKVDAPPFSNVTWGDVLDEANDGGSGGEASADDGAAEFLELRRRELRDSLMLVSV